MKTNGFASWASVVAVRAALIAAALAAAPDRAVAQSAQELSKPTSTVEVGVGGVSQGSYKAGEYNGLENKGGFGIGNLDVRGGASFDSPSTLRWRIKGTDLGLETRSLSAQVGVPGKYQINFGYDELRRNRSDSYQTPYNGAGTNTLTLPGTWQVPTVPGGAGNNVISARGLIKAIGDAPYISTLAANFGALVSPTAAQTALVDAAADADVPLFHNVNLFTKRTKFDAGVAYSFDERWGVDANVRPEHKDGLKPMGTVSRNSASTGGASLGDVSTVIPDLIDNDHNQINTNLHFKGKKSFAQVGYYGSFFKNNVPFMSWQNWATGPTATGAGTVNTISSAPDNSFIQVHASGGYNMSPTTKLVVNGSYARNTQNDNFITNPTTPVVPVSSLNGLVVWTAFNAKLTNRPSKKLTLNAAYKFDDRDNRTAIHIFQYSDAEETPVANANFPAGATNPYGAVVAQNANANRPYSRKANQVNADADYALAKGQWIKGGYDFEKIDRACTGSWINCVDAATTNENTLRAEWRANVGEDLNARVDYAYSARRTPNYDENAFLALVPYANVIPAGQTMSALQAMIQYGLTGYGPVLGFNDGVSVNNTFFPSNNNLPNALYANNNRISELIGMRRYFVADRNRNKVRSLLNWQAADRLSFQGGLDFTGDDYPDSTYGLQNAKGWALNLDGTYALTDEVSASAFYTYENQRAITAGNTFTANSNVATIANSQPGVVGLSGNTCDSYTTLQQRNNNNKLDPCLNWSANMLDKANTLGFGLRKQASRLDLTGNLIFTWQRSDNNVSGGNWANNILNGPGAAPTTIAAYFIPATPLPTVTIDTAELRLNGKYAIGAHHTVRVAYAYLHMNNADWMYEGMQFGSLSAQLPTNEQPFNFGVNVVGVSYILSF